MAGEAASPTTPLDWLYHPFFPREWRRTSLYSLATWINGMAFRNIDFSECGLPVIKIAEIKNGITGQTKFTDSDYADDYFVTEGDMLFSWSGQPETSIDAFWWRGPDGWINQHIFKVLPNERKCLAGFFYYLLKYLKPNFVAIAQNKQTTGLGHVTRGDLQAIQVGLPPRPLQGAIAHILGAFDDRIELNRRMNQTLEAIARAIFKSWFVDFEPVRAKAEGRDPGLPDHIAALFPDSFEESELGEIPRGWTVGPIGQQVDAVGGSTPSTSEPGYWDGGFIHFATPKDLSALASPVLLDTARQITEEGLSQISSGLLPEGTVLLSSRAPVGYLAIAEIPVAINQGFIAMKCDGPLSNYYVLWWTEFNMQLIRSHAGGTTFQEISKRSFRPLPALVPRHEVVHAFDATVQPLYRRIVNNEQQSHTLANIRDGLVPRLISGEVRVRDPEAIVGRAT
jgi:type I restriction enzyme S subunit